MSFSSKHWVLAGLVGLSAAMTPTGSVSATTATLEQRAAPFAVFLREIRALRSRIPGDEKRARRLLDRMGPARLAESSIAHYALGVARDAEFQALIAEQRSEHGRSGVLTRLVKDEIPIRLWVGMGPVVSRLLTQMAKDTEPVIAIDAAFRLKARRLLSDGEPPSRNSNKSDAPKGRAGRSNPYVAKRGRAMIDAILELAARHLLGLTTGPEIDTDLPEASTARCLRIAHVTYKQCLSAVHGEGERAFCTGHHGFGDLARCWRRFIPAPVPSAD